MLNASDFLVVVVTHHTLLGRLRAARCWLTNSRHVVYTDRLAATEGVHALPDRCICAPSLTP